MFEDIFPQKEPKPVKKIIKKKPVTFPMKELSLAEQIRKLDNKNDFHELTKILDITKHKVHKAKKSKK